MDRKTNGSMQSLWIIPLALASLLAFGCEGQIEPLGVNPIDTLTPEAAEALMVAPTWLYDDLAELFTRLDASDQVRAAALILDAEDPATIDEIAFTVAHISPEVYWSADFDEAIIVENAEGLYAFDVFLDYVELVDYGDPLAGGDYYTTARYEIGSPEVGKDVFELDREDYYWFIVHPQIEDEYPYYIDPGSGWVEAPPTGRFWREYLMENADDGYPLLKDELAGVETLWNQRQNTATDNGAIGVITQWMLDVLDFGSGYERPIQPVRIYGIHLGRCGEHADITSAAARAALIPVVNISALANDHVWNEFFDGAWHQWEPVNVMVDNFESYDTDGEKGWWRLACSYATRGDGLTWLTTGHYSDTADLAVTVSDANSEPVDGAQILLTATLYGYHMPAFWGITGPDGSLDITIGEKRSYYASLTSALGDYPSVSEVRVVPLSEAGASYTWDVDLEGAGELVPVNEAAIPPDPDGTYKLEIAYNFPTEVLHGDYLFTGQEFTQLFEPGQVLFFICDQPNYALFLEGEPFEGFEVARGSGCEPMAFTIPDRGFWYVVFSNRESLVGAPVGDVTILEYKDNGEGYELADTFSDHMIIPAGRDMAFRIHAH
ncbi:hypothetical protein ACFL4G_03500 [Thermodesulfobacteriota bacterium]